MNIATNITLDLWQTLCEMSPYLLFGFLIAGLMSVFVSPETVEKHLGGRGLWPVFKASLVGVPLPLCSCGVIPVAASLRRHGSSKGATAAFLISTPQTGVDSIAVTYGMLGPVFAVFRPVAAFISGLIGGWLIEVTEEKDSKATNVKACHDECCASGPRRNIFTQALRYGFIILPRDIARPLAVGLLVAGIISAIVPGDFFTNTTGNHFVQMLIMMAFGIPLYVCATTSVPIASAMIAKGISPGAALVFLMTGPATNAATIATIWKTMGKRAASIYLAVVAGTALASGLILDGFFTTAILSSEHIPHHMLPAWITTASAITVILMLCGTLIPRSAEQSHESPEKEYETNTELKITGMTCSHCAGTIQRTLKEITGVTSAKVSLSRGIASVAGNKYDVATMIAAIEELGYKAKVEKHKT